jgi:hypothetical protein
MHRINRTSRVPRPMARVLAMVKRLRATPTCAKILIPNQLLGHIM